MVIVKLQGGLGNQMFQYAAAKALSNYNNTALKFDLSHLLDRSPLLKIVFRDYDLNIFPNIQVPVATKEEISALIQPFSNKFINSTVKKTIGIKSYFKEKSFRYDKAFTHLSANVYLDGYWQSEKYFELQKEIIKQDFAFAPLQLQVNTNLAAEIKGNASVCLNVRRGDFINHTGSNSFHGFKGLDYIKKAVAVIETKVSNPHFYIFSDDITWCRENISLQYPLTFVEHRYAGEKFGDYLQLMSGCKNFIIPNSSFGWWAAWLNNDLEKTVVAPLAWFSDPAIDTSDIIPKQWLRI